jgi:hypothetical protein
MSDEKPAGWLDDYVDVAERIKLFNEKYPDGSLQTLSWEIREIGERVFVVYRAMAYRTPDDTRPGQGSAWEPFPGRTPYTRDSELMNAETAAWGRAIVALGIVASRKVATKQDVKARQEPEKPAPAKKPHEGPTAPQRKLIKDLIDEHSVTRLELAGIIDQWDLELSKGWVDRLTTGKDGTAAKLIDTLSRLGKPQVDA